MGLAYLRTRNRHAAHFSAESSYKGVYSCCALELLVRASLSVQRNLECLSNYEKEGQRVFHLPGSPRLYTALESVDALI